jgi:hypothetical protein
VASSVTRAVAIFVFRDAMGNVSCVDGGMFDALREDADRRPRRTGTIRRADDARSTFAQRRDVRRDRAFADGDVDGLPDAQRRGPAHDAPLRIADDRVAAFEHRRRIEMPETVLRALHRRGPRSEPGMLGARQPIAERIDA